MKISDALKLVESENFIGYLYKTYSGDVENQRLRYVALLNKAAILFGYDADIIVSRAPGRVNLMGRHIDYMGGYVNPIATTFDVLTVLEKRDDDIVMLYNMDPMYKSSSFCISEELPDTEINDLADWDQWTAKNGEKRKREGKEYTWVDYIKGLFIYLQVIFKEKVKLDGFNILVDGAIPPKRGMSSSSALVISVALALKTIYRFDISMGDFIDIVGYSEWYRLTRGGTADHAAIILSRKGYVSHIGCLPTKVEDVKYAPLLSEYSLYLIDSGIERPHTEKAFNILRSTAASYRIGVLLLKTLFQEHRNRIRLLRDFNTRNLNISLIELYEMLKKLPVRATRRELYKMIDERYHSELDTIFSNHREPADGYRIRENVLYGISETERARIFPMYLENKNMNKILRLFEVSHDGDRVFVFDENLNKEHWDSSCSSSDSMLNKYIEVLRGNYPREQKEKVQLHWIPGGYSRSIEEIDFICDFIKNNYSKYAAAQLMGAGLGGNVIAIIRRDKVEEILESLYNSYLEQYGIKLRYIRVISSDGAKIVFF